MRGAALCAIFLAAAPFEALADPAPVTAGPIVSRVRYHYECVTDSSDPHVRLAWRFATSAEHRILGSYWAVRAADGRRLYVTSIQALGDGEPPASEAGYDPGKCRVTARESLPSAGRSLRAVDRVGRSRSLGDAAFLDTPPPDAPPALALAARFPSKGERVTIAGAGSRLIEARVAERFPAEGFFILDRAVAPGHTGGPVLDRAGRAYGVVTHVGQPAAFVRRLDAAALAKEIVWGTPGDALRR